MYRSVFVGIFGDNFMIIIWIDEDAEDGEDDTAYFAASVPSSKHGVHPQELSSWVFSSVPAEKTSSVEILPKPNQMKLVFVSPRGRRVWCCVGPRSWIVPPEMLHCYPFFFCMCHQLHFLWYHYSLSIIFKTFLLNVKHHNHYSTCKSLHQHHWRRQVCPSWSGGPSCCSNALPGASA